MIIISEQTRADSEAHLHRRPQGAAIDLRVVTVIVAVYLAGLALVSMSSRWRGQRRALRHAKLGVYSVSVAMSCGVCVLCASMLTVMRIFWTGAESSFQSRAMIVIPGSKSIRLDADRLLSMSGTELVLMTIAMVLTAIPLLIIIDAVVLRGGVHGGYDLADGTKRSVFDRICRHRLMGNRISGGSLRWVTSVCYVMITAILWLAPWSVTMAQALWGGV